nr:hypothetical protein [Arthrobacter dokdonellae]
MGWAHRRISSGNAEVDIAGVGGMLESENARGFGLGERLLRAAHSSMLEAEGIQFGYLGCRETVVPFYDPVDGCAFQWANVRSLVGGV